MVAEVLKFLLENTDSNLVITFLSISATASILFISISIIPFQQYASTQSIALLKYLKKNISLIVSFVLILFFILILLVLPLLNQINLYVILSFALTLFVFILIGNAWRTIINLLDPEYFLLPAIVKDIKKTFTNCFKVAQEKETTVPEKMSELRDMMEQAMMNSAEINPEEKYYRITKNEIQPGFDKIILLKELIIIYVRNNQTHLFSSSITHLEECITYYIRLRKKYIINFDDFLIEFSDDVSDIISIVEKQSNIHYQRKIWRFIRSICIGTCSIENLQFESGYNYICSPYIEILHKQFVKDLVNHNNDSAFEIARCIGEIGSFWAIKQIFNSATDIIKKLTLISGVAYIKSRTEITYIAREHISKIFFNLIIYYNAKKNYEFAFEDVLDIYKKLLDGEPLHSTSQTDFIFRYDPDITKDRSIAAIIRSLLFPIIYDSENDYDLIQRQFHRLVENLLELLLSTISNNQSSQIGFITQIHQIGLYFLTYIHHQISTDILLYYNFLTIPNDYQKQNIDEQFGILLDFYFSIVEKIWSKKKVNIHHKEDIIHSFISLMTMDIYWSSKFNQDRIKKIRERIERYFFQIRKEILTLKMNRDELKVILELGLYISKITELKDVARKLIFLSKRAYNNNVDFYSHSMHRMNFIKRPMHTFNQELFYNIDKDVFNVA